jgi:hypothetical protein
MRSFESAAAVASLRLPGNFANRFGQPLEPRLQGLADAGRIPIAPGTLDQYPPGRFVAGQCETGTPNPLTSRPLRWHQAEKGQSRYSRPQNPGAIIQAQPAPG